MEHGGTRVAKKDGSGKIVPFRRRKAGTALYAAALPLMLAAGIAGAVLEPYLPKGEALLRHWRELQSHGDDRAEPVARPVAAYRPATGTARPAEPRPVRFETARGIRFSLCGAGRRVNCVVDGDTFWLNGEKIRIADIDTPELSPPRCAREKELGLRAKHTLQDVLNRGPFELAAVDGPDTDRYGRKLRTVMRNGQSLGDVLISYGVARPWDGQRRGWCG